LKSIVEAASRGLERARKSLTPLASSIQFPYVCLLRLCLQSFSFPWVFREFFRLSMLSAEQGQSDVNVVDILCSNRQLRGSWRLPAPRPPVARRARARCHPV